MISQDEKNMIVTQIEKLVGSKPFVYLKFCSQKKYAQDVLNGDLFSNTAEWFRNKENETGERGQGDKDELMLPFVAEKVSVFDYETGEHVMDYIKPNVTLRFNDDDHLPLVCFVGIPLRDMNLLEYDESHAVFSLPFSQEEHQTMEERFGKYCVLIDARELENKIVEFCDKNNCDYIFDKVDYRDKNSLERMKAFASLSPARVLFKNSDLAYQREYRLVLPDGVLEDNYVKLGGFDNATILDVSQIKNMGIRIDYTTTSTVS